MENCDIWNLYGPAETTIDCTFHLVEVIANAERIPIGLPLSNYQSVILDEFSQSVIIGQEGELVVGGVGVFAGYFGRNDLTNQVLIKINDQIFYRTGDLVRMDNDGLLYYRGRKDYQIKLHGQRIELGEIEQCLLTASVSACVVIKWDKDYLVAYVQSSTADEKQLRKHCQSYLPPHMIPSLFIILDKLPLNANGKIDRKLLPLPNLSPFTFLSPNESIILSNQLEERIHDVWCQVLQCIRRQIPITANFFSIGGHSLLFIELFHRYQSMFDFDSHVFSITLFLQQPTILQHSQLLQTITLNHEKSIQWHPLHIDQGNIFLNLSLATK